MYPHRVYRRLREVPRREEPREKERSLKGEKNLEEEKKIWTLWGSRKKIEDKLQRIYNYYQPPVKPLVVRAPVMKCPRCGYFWIPKKRYPKICPSCASRLEKEYDIAGDLTIKVEGEGVDKGKLEEIREVLGKALRSVEFLKERYRQNSDITISLSTIELSLKKIEDTLGEL